MAGPIPNLTVTASAIMSWQASKVDTVLGLRTSNSQMGLSQIFQSLTGATFPASQMTTYQVTIPAGGNTVLNLSTPAKNVMEDSTATLTALFAMVVWLPSVSQSATLGSAASQVTIGRASVNPALVMGLTSGSAFVVKNGEFHFWETPLAAGYAINAGQNSVLITNNDSSNPATVMIGAVGNG